MPDYDKAREAVRAALRERSIEPARLAREAKLDPGTVNDFLNGQRWPRSTSLGKIETYFDWAPGYLDRVARGIEEPNVGASLHAGDGILLDIDASALDGLSLEERDEVVTAAKLRALQVAREIRQGK